MLLFNSEPKTSASLHALTLHKLELVSLCLSILGPWGSQVMRAFCVSPTLSCHEFPLARQAVRTAINAQTSGDCGRIMIVLLTDGRANVSLGKSNEDPEAIAEGAPKPTQDQLKTEVLDMAKRVAASGFNLLVIDTENQVCGASPLYQTF